MWLSSLSDTVYRKCMWSSSCIISCGVVLLHAPSVSSHWAFSILLLTKQDQPRAHVESLLPVFLSSGEASACLYSQQHKESLNSKLLCVALLSSLCSAVLSSGEKSTYWHFYPWWVCTVGLTYLQPPLLPQLGQWLWIPAALRSLGVTDGPGSLHPRGLLLRSLVRALSRNVPSAVTAGGSPLPSPGTAGHRYVASSNTEPFHPVRFLFF